MVNKKKKNLTEALFGYLLSDVHLALVGDLKEKEEWAKPLTQLWQSRLFNPQAEREYNQWVGLQAPYCSICLLFHTYHQVRTNSTPSTQSLFQHLSLSYFCLYRLKKLQFPNCDTRGLSSSTMNLHF